ncbi:MAG TPA: hypothetical protein VFG68_04005 [Fimbriiglobus sp.]|nr:hypothetical protein [Fimbriiglobus sp.]
MPESPPRLASADPSSQPGYAPLSWTAVAALALAVGYALVMAVVLFSALRRGQQVIEPVLLFLPALVVVLAFVARRQIRASEGTRVGERYANLAWWIAVVCGLGYVTYLFTVEFLIRRQADQEFVTWSNYLKDLNPKDPKDPNFFHAVHMTLDPGVRGSVPAGDPSKIEATFRDAVVGMRGMDLIRVCARNSGAVEFRPHGLREWQQKPNQITCTLTATLVTPEGEHQLVVPMRAVIDEKTKNRRWQISPEREGYIKSRALSLYGWQVEYLEATGRQFAQDFLGRLNSPGGAPFAYAAFVHPGWGPRQAVGLLAGLPALAGSPATLLPYPPGGVEHLTQKVFSKPGGGPHDPSDVARFVALWRTPGRFVPAGTYARNNPDVHPTLSLEQDAVECRVPIEVQLGAQRGGPGASLARGALILRVTRASIPDFFATLDANRKAGASTGLSDRPSTVFANQAIPWRVIHIETDLRPVSPQELGEPERGMPGGMPGV